MLLLLLLLLLLHFEFAMALCHTTDLRRSSSSRRHPR
jgi:hypothetical protein